MFTRDPMSTPIGFVTTSDAAPTVAVNLEVGPERVLSVIPIISAMDTANGDVAIIQSPPFPVQRFGNATLINGAAADLPLPLSFVPGPNPWTAVLKRTSTGVYVEVTGELGKTIEWRVTLLTPCVMSAPSLNGQGLI